MFNLPARPEVLISFVKREPIVTYVIEAHVVILVVLIALDK